MNKLYIFAYKAPVAPMDAYAGYFDGTFHPKPGVLNSFDELMDQDYVEFFGDCGFLEHIPQRFFGDLYAKMEAAYTRLNGGEEQLSLFEI
ncbi:hypothetical protein [Sporolactobacillus putidus]|uniref:Uncharacterized protein n=1 Tax=Sporolactobacillus putidus TaxID=492735 RepID=A0A917RZV7_9BACL|nr:hypothetical protein [Sporolactobacillus putidus]GGL45551.1 hypothetical protein GCM10007968_07070 [Sporolactobacillus putidus]